jgi:5'-nucleotidase
VFNSGAIRIDDVLPAGPITQYDVIRMLPFGADDGRAHERGNAAAECSPLVS